MMSIGSVVRLLAQRDPDRPAVTHEAITITRRELDLSTSRLARVYRDLGVEQDDFVTIALPKGIAYYQPDKATSKLGPTPQPLSARLP